MNDIDETEDDFEGNSDEPERLPFEDLDRRFVEKYLKEDLIKNDKALLKKLEEFL